jgi:hypothetical protein
MGQKLQAGNVAKAQQEAQRERQRTLARELVKILRQNPANANSFEYERIVDAIDQYERIAEIAESRPSRG